MFVFKADNMLLHQLHSIPELQLQNIRMAPQKKSPKKPKQMNKKTSQNLKKKPKPQKMPNWPCSPIHLLPTTVFSQ